MDEQRIEELVEIKMDNLDAHFMRGDIDEEEYRARVKAIDDWSKEEYEKISRVLP